MPTIPGRARIWVAALAFSAAGLVGLTHDEGFCSPACIPIPGDVPTLGFGTTEGVKLGDTTTPPAALARALRDVQKFEGAIKQCVKVPLYQHEYDAYVKFSYNIGVGKSGVADGFCYAKRGGYSTLVTKLNAGDYAGACAEISRWKRAAGKDCSVQANKCYGLIKTRARTRALCEGAT